MVGMETKISILVKKALNLELQKYEEFLEMKKRKRKFLKD